MPSDSEKRLIHALEIAKKRTLKIRITDIAHVLLYSIAIHHYRTFHWKM